MECSRLCSSTVFKFFSHTILLHPSSFCRDKTQSGLLRWTEEHQVLQKEQQCITSWYFLACQLFHRFQCSSSCGSRWGAERTELRPTASAASSSFIMAPTAKQENSVRIRFQRRDSEELSPGGLRRNTVTQHSPFSYLSQWLSSKTHSRQRSHILPPPGPNVGQQLGQTHKRSPLDPGNKRIIIIKVYPRKSMLPISSSPFSCTFPNGNEARPRQWAGPVCVCAESRDRLSRRRAKKPGRHRNYYQETEKKTKTWPASGQKHHLIDGVPAFLNLFNAKRRKSNDGCHRSTNRRSQHTQPNEIQSDGCDGNKSKMLIIIAKKTLN